MRKLISFMHVSLDGFVCGPNGEMDWIKIDQEMFDHVGIRIAQTDTAMYGRVTYQMMESYWPTAGDSPTASKHDIEHAKWYKTVHKIVLSKTLADADSKLKDRSDLEIISTNLSERVTQIKTIHQSGSKEILVFGSPRATHALMQLNLIDGFWLFVNPVILGTGVPLFKDIKEKINLDLITTKRFVSGVTEMNYLVTK